MKVKEKRRARKEWGLARQEKGRQGKVERRVMI